MKKLILTLLVLLLPYSLIAQVTKIDPTKKIGISLYGGVNIPVNGNISSTVKTTDFLNAGPQYGFALSYYFTESFGVELNNMFALNFYKDKFKTEGKDPAATAYSFSVNGIYNFGCLLKSTNISPFVKGGVGVYGWKHLDDAPWNGGEVMNDNGTRHQGMSFGFNVALGADYLISKHFSVGLVLDYNIYFPKNEEKFGKDFAAQGNLTPQLRLSYYLPTH